MPNEINAPKINGQTKRSTTDTKIETTPAIIATQRFPLKKDNQSGNFVLLNLLKQEEPITPARIPINGLAILSNAIVAF